MSAPSLRPNSFAVGAACGIVATALAWFFFPSRPRSHTCQSSEKALQVRPSLFPASHTHPFLSPRDAGVLTLLSAYAISAAGPATPSTGSSRSAASLAAPATPASAEVHASRLRALNAYIQSHLAALAAEKAFVDAVGALFDAIYARASVRRAVLGLPPSSRDATNAHVSDDTRVQSGSLQGRGPTVTVGDVSSFFADLGVSQATQALVLPLLVAATTRSYPSPFPLSPSAAAPHAPVLPSAPLTRALFLSALRVWERAPAAAAALEEFEFFYTEQYLPLVEAQERAAAAAATAAAAPFATAAVAASAAVRVSPSAGSGAGAGSGSGADTADGGAAPGEEPLFVTPQKVKPPPLSLVRSSSPQAAVADNEEETKGACKGACKGGESDEEERAARTAYLLKTARAAAASAAMAATPGSHRKQWAASPAAATTTAPAAAVGSSPAASLASGHGGRSGGAGVWWGEEGALRPTPLPRLVFPPSPSPTTTTTTPSSASTAAAGDAPAAAAGDAADAATAVAEHAPPLRARGLTLYLANATYALHSAPVPNVSTHLGTPACWGGVFGDGAGWSPLLPPSAAAELHRRGLLWVEGALGQWKPAAAALGPVLQAWAGWVAVAPAQTGPTPSKGEGASGTAIVPAAEAAAEAPEAAAAAAVAAAAAIAGSGAETEEGVCGGNGSRVVAIVPPSLFTHATPSSSSFSPSLSPSPSPSAIADAHARVLAAAADGGITIVTSAAAAAALAAAAAAAAEVEAAAAAAAAVGEAESAAGARGQHDQELVYSWGSWDNSSSYGKLSSTPSFGAQGHSSNNNNVSHSNKAVSSAGSSGSVPQPEDGRGPFGFDGRTGGVAGSVCVISGAGSSGGSGSSLSFQNGGSSGVVGGRNHQEEDEDEDEDDEAYRTF